MKKTPRVIFFSGVHGVGKGWLINEVRKQVPLPHYSASELIKQEKQLEVDKDKVVIGAEDNQDFLVNALGALNSESTILLDGHFCLRSSSGIYEVSRKTFEQMDIVAVILVNENAEVIQQRLSQRDGLNLSLEEIEEFQEAEVRRAELVSKAIRVPLIRSTSNEIDRVTKFLSSLAGKQRIT